MYPFTRSSRRRRLLGSPMDERARRALQADCAFLSRLDERTRDHVVDMARVFVREKTFEGAKGFNVTDAMKFTVAAQACWPLASVGIDPIRDEIYPNVRTIILYPGAYWSTQPQFGPGGVVYEGRANLGEAHHGPGLSSSGPVLLSWADSLDGAKRSASLLEPESDSEGRGLRVAFGELRRNGRNLVIHEFAHKLDMLDGVVDGTPPIPEGCVSKCWRDVMTASLAQLRAEAARGRPTILDAYGAQSPGEFFAVACEVFFMQPKVLRAAHPDLFEVLSCVFKQRS